MSECSEKGSWKGDCCCNCVYQCDIVDIHGKHTSYGCAVFFTQHQVLKFKHIQSKGDLGKVMLFKDKHGMCEMHNERESQ